MRMDAVEKRSLREVLDRVHSKGGIVPPSQITLLTRNDSATRFQGSEPKSPRTSAESDLRRPAF